LNSNLFRIQTYISLEGAKVLVVNTALGQDQYLLKESVLFDFNASLNGMKWSMPDKTPLEGKSLYLLNKSYSRALNDSIYAFKLESTRWISDGYHLSEYLISYDYGFIGLKFTDSEGDLYLSCRDKRFKKLVFK